MKQRELRILRGCRDKSCNRAASSLAKNISLFIEAIGPSLGDLQLAMRYDTAYRSCKFSQAHEEYRKHKI